VPAAASGRCSNVGDFRLFGLRRRRGFGAGKYRVAFCRNNDTQHFFRNRHKLASVYLPSEPYLPSPCSALFTSAFIRAWNGGPSPGISGMWLPTIVTPLGCPPATTALGRSRHGMTFSGGDGIGTGLSVGHSGALPNRVGFS
jgi:hypothetical protein